MARWAIQRTVHATVASTQWIVNTYLLLLLLLGALVLVRGAAADLYLAFGPKPPIGQVGDDVQLPEEKADC